MSWNEKLTYSTCKPLQHTYIILVSTNLTQAKSSQDPNMFDLDKSFARYIWHISFCCRKVSYENIKNWQVTLILYINQNINTNFSSVILHHMSTSLHGISRFQEAQRHQLTKTTDQTLTVYPAIQNEHVTKIQDIGKLLKSQLRYILFNWYFSPATILDLRITEILLACWCTRVTRTESSQQPLVAEHIICQLDFLTTLMVIAKKSITYRYT